MAGFIPAIPTIKAQRRYDRDHRDKPGDDIGVVAASILDT
jgi:hypothetical protein